MVSKIINNNKIYVININNLKNKKKYLFYFIINK